METSDNSLFKEAYENCEAEDVKNLNVTEFIDNCERVYNMTTEEFIIMYERNGFEGNVDQQLWYQFSK